MKQDALDALSGRFPKTLPSKESLNHPGIINHVAGFDVFDDTPRAFEIAWRKLGITLHSAPPEGNVPRPRVPGGTWTEGGHRYADVGVYPTAMPLDYCPNIPKTDDEWVFKYDPSEDDFDLQARIDWLRGFNGGFRRTFGDHAVHYHLYYTTLFMWAVVKFDWEPFMIAAGTDPKRFDEQFWAPWSRISRKHVQSLAAMDEEVVFIHDDLAMTTGPVFPMDFYDRYILPRYPSIMEPAVKAGKKIVFVIDGNSEPFLDRLLELPIDGLMFENPAVPFQRVLDTFGKAGRGFIGGIETAMLTNGTPEQIARHTREVVQRGREYPGFIISSCGGIYGNIPLENVLAYFRTRGEMGCPAEL